MLGRRRLWAFWLAAAVLAGSCTPTTGGDRASSAAPSETPVRGGTIVIGTTTSPRTLQPVLSTDTASSSVWGELYLGLTRTNRETGETEPFLAQKFEVGADGKTITYTLRDGLVWSDGTPFTGDDYKYTVEAVMRSKKTARKSQVDLIVGAKDYADGKTDSISGIKIDGKTIAISLTKTYCPAIAALGGAGAGGILPSAKFKAVWDNKTTDVSKNIDDNPLNMAPPASMGPFVFKELSPGVSVTLVRNEKYFLGAPFVDTYVIKNYADATAIKNALTVGEITYGTAEAKDFDELSKNDQLTPYRFKSLSYNFIAWNSHAAKAPWLASVDVRQALWYGLDVDTIIKRIVFGYGTKQLAHNVPVSWAYDPSGLTDYKYDMAKAKQLIEKAGAKMGPDGIYRWTDGSPMKMRIETNQGNNARETILQVAQEQYKLIGIGIDPQLESPNQLVDRISPGTDYEGFILGYALSADPDFYDIWHSSQTGKGQFNNVFYSNPDVDRALTANREGPDCGKDARKRANHTVDLALNRDAPYTFLYSQDTLLFANKALRNFQPFTFSREWNVEKWWFKK